MNICIIGVGNIGGMLKEKFLSTRSHNIFCIDVDKSKSNTKGNTMVDILKKSDLIFICLPTPYNTIAHALDTIDITEYLKIINRLTTIPIILKSTLPIGYIDSIIGEHPELEKKIIYNPEFSTEESIRSGNVQKESQVFGYATKDLDKFITEKLIPLYLDSRIIDSKTKIIRLSYEEAEITKLMRNAYLAMRVSFFNEVASLCNEKFCRTEEVIHAISEDSRIGDFYNKVSFGYGGSCFHKDMYYLYEKFDFKYPLISSIHKSNRMRLLAIRDYIQQYVMKHRSHKITFIISEKEEDSGISEIFCYLLDDIPIVNVVKVNPNDGFVKREILSSDIVVCDKKYNNLLENFEGKVFNS